MHEMNSLSGNDAFKPRDSFRSLRVGSSVVNDGTTTNIDADQTKDDLVSPNRPGRLNKVSGHLSGVSNDIDSMLKKELSKKSNVAETGEM